MDPGAAYAPHDDLRSVRNGRLRRRQRAGPAVNRYYFGQTVDDWKTIQEHQGIDKQFLPAGNRGFGPKRLCHYFK